MCGGRKAVLPLISATLAMKVCDRTRLRLSPNTSLLSGRSVVCTPTGIGKERGSITVSEMALATKNQSWFLRPRKRGVAQRAMPASRRRACSSSVGRQIGRSPL